MALGHKIVMQISPTIITMISLSIGLPIIMALIRKLKVLQYDSYTTKSFEELREQYSGWDKFGRILYILIAIALGFIIWKALVFIDSLRIPDADSGALFFSTPESFWAILAIFLSLFLALVPWHYLLLTLLGKQDYTEFVEYGNQLSGGVDSWKLARYMGYVFISIVIVFTLLALDSYLIATSQKVVINRFFSAGENAYKLSDIKYITQTQKIGGSPPIFKIGFSDGSRYDLQKTLLFFNEFSDQSRVANFLSRQSDIQIIISEPYPN